MVHLRRAHAYHLWQARSRFLLLCRHLFRADLTLINSQGMVASESDVRGLISNWHRMFKLGGLVGTLPWLVHPIINAPVLRRYFMPQKGQASGSGYIMSVHEQMFAPPSGKGSDDTEKVAITRPGNQSYHAPSLRANLSAAKMPDGSYLSPEEIQHQCYLNTVAGQDTTASLLNSLLSYVCADSRIYSSLMGEIGQLEARGHFSAIARYDETSEADMPYFNACVHETLRLAPPTPIPLPRYAPRGGSWVCESQVPGGTEIAANPWVIGRSKEAFGEDAECFKPERWIATGEAGSSRAGQDKQRVSRLKKFEFAWGFGDRRCVGRNIALFEANKFCVQVSPAFCKREPQVTPGIHSDLAHSYCASSMSILWVKRRQSSRTLGLICVRSSWLG